MIKNNWRKLDNTAKIFSLNDQKTANTFRFSALLKETIDVNTLTIALNMSLQEFQAFKVKTKAGLFWNYFEYNPKEPIITKENDIPCKYINFKKNNDYLFKVTYFKKKINLDVFHALTDGIGASQFFKSLITNYITLKYDLKINKISNIKKLSYPDQYLEKYNKKLKSNKPKVVPYQLPGKILKNTNNTHHYTVRIEDIKRVSKKYGVTITEFLSAVYLNAFYSTFYKKGLKKEFVLTIPVDLRKFYKINTLSNFFVSMNINSRIIEKNLSTFNEILTQVHQEFSETITPKKIEERLTDEVNLGMNLPIRLIPLFIKKPFMKNFGHLFGKGTTSTLSNLGVIGDYEEYKQYINNIYVLVMPGRVQKIKCTICSFDNKLNITMNANIDDSKFQKNFLKILKSHINNVTILNNINKKK